MSKNPLIHATTGKKEKKNQALVNELKTGEKSGMIPNFNPNKFFDKIHQTYLRKYSY